MKKYCNVINVISSILIMAVSCNKVSIGSRGLAGLNNIPSINWGASIEEIKIFMDKNDYDLAGEAADFLYYEGKENARSVSYYFENGKLSASMLMLKKEFSYESILTGYDYIGEHYFHHSENSNNAKIYISKSLNTVASAEQGTYGFVIGWSELDDSNIENTINAIDLGLSVKWADRNFGTNYPEERGFYYSWGGIEFKGIWEFTEENYEYYIAPDEYMDLCDGNISGTEYDIVNVTLGNGWRMPTLEEARELCSQCSFAEISVYGVQGLQVTGPNGKDIFIPYTDSITEYWTGTEGDNTAAYYLGSTEEETMYTMKRRKYNSGVIRPVIDY